MREAASPLATTTGQGYDAGEQVQATRSQLRECLLTILVHEI